MISLKFATFRSNTRRAKLERIHIFVLRLQSGNRHLISTGHGFLQHHGRRNVLKLKVPLFLEGLQELTLHRLHIDRIVDTYRV